MIPILQSIHYFHDKCKNISNEIDTRTYYTANCDIIKIKVASYEMFCTFIISRFSVAYLKRITFAM